MSLADKIARLVLAAVGALALTTASLFLLYNSAFPPNAFFGFVVMTTVSEFLPWKRHGVYRWSPLIVPLVPVLLMLFYPRVSYARIPPDYLEVSRFVTLFSFYGTGILAQMLIKLAGRRVAEPELPELPHKQGGFR